jgi:hypothetical protein
MSARKVDEPSVARGASEVSQSSQRHSGERCCPDKSSCLSPRPRVRAARAELPGTTGRASCRRLSAPCPAPHLAARTHWRRACPCLATRPTRRRRPAACPSAPLAVLPLHVSTGSRSMSRPGCDAPDLSRLGSVAAACTVSQRLRRYAAAAAASKPLLAGDCVAMEGVGEAWWREAEREVPCAHRRRAGPASRAAQSLSQAAWERRAWAAPPPRLSSRVAR